MILPAVPDRAVAELGRTEGGADTCALLVRDQDTRRLLLLRAVLDAAEAADSALCPGGAKSRLRDDWALLTEADRIGLAAPAGDGGHVEGTGPASAGTGRGGETADSPGRAGRAEGDASAWRAGRAEGDASASRAGRSGESVTSAVRSGRAGGSAVSAARARLTYPLTGPWARRVLRGLTAEAGPVTEARKNELALDLAYFGSVAAGAAARAGIPFTVRLTARDGRLVVPSLGALRTAASGDVPVEVTHHYGCLTLRQSDSPDVTVYLESGTGAWSGSPTWTPAHALPGLVPGAPPLPLDDLDPYRASPREPDQYALSGPTTLDDAGRKRWLQIWSGTAAALGAGSEQRIAEALALLRCLVPLEMPPGADGRGSCSATRREAFGAVLSSTPPTAVTFAATLVHEMGHTKLAALSDMVTLHQAGSEARYFAPWRPDSRPYDGLLQGTYSHLALADFFQRRALVVTSAEREAAWSQHARYRAQVGAALPALVGSPDLTAPGRRFVDEMVSTYEGMAAHPAPRGHTARAQAYVKAVRALWTQRQLPAHPFRNR